MEISILTTQVIAECRIYINKYFLIQKVKRKSKPAGTIEYTVEENETLEKIALKWNTIPSEIHRLNRLVTRIIFPGIVFAWKPESLILLRVLMPKGVK